jgi:hypothetical protein
MTFRMIFGLGDRPLYQPLRVEIRKDKMSFLSILPSYFRCDMVSLDISR